MKKIIIIVLILFIVTGCTSVSNYDIIGCINEVLKYESTLYNKNGTGYKYYVPRDFVVSNDNDFNQTLLHNGNEYYLYIDILSYYNKVNINYVKDENAYYGTAISYKDKKGFVEITENNSYFYIKMMYNYGIIEARVKENEIKDTIVNMTLILYSIRYNDGIITNMIEDNILEVKEKVFELEGPKEKTDSKTYLEYIEEYGDYMNETEIKDPDLIN